MITTFLAFPAQTKCGGVIKEKPPMLTAFAKAMPAVFYERRRGHAQ